MLEAALRILDRDGLAALNTNRVAEVAGVSIGTVYQYFADKTALLDALAERELKSLSEAVLAALTAPAPAAAGDRVRAIVQALLQAYGGRTHVHRLLVQHLLARSGNTPLPGMREAVITMLSGTGIVGPDQAPRTLAPGAAFVLTHAVAGVMRALMAQPDKLQGPERAPIEDALVALVRTMTAPAADAARG